MYFTYLISSNQPGNKLQKEAVGLLQAESNLLINNADAFIETVRRQIELLNCQNPRCKPLKVSTTELLTWGHSVSLLIGNGTANVASFALHPVKNGKSDARQPEGKA